MNFNQAIQRIQDENLNVFAFGLYQKNSTSIYRFENGLFDIRSLSKTVMTLLTGIIIEKTDLSLDTFVYDILKDHIDLTNQDNLENLSKIQIRHCLNHTLGFDKRLMMRQDIQHLKGKEFLNYVINEPLIYKPGEYYLYSNAGFYLLSATLEHFLNKPLEAVFKEFLLNPLNIKAYKWEKYGPYLAGATRLYLKPLDLMKFGKILLYDGLYKDTQIVNSAWIKYMKTLTSLTPHQDTPGHTFRRYAYGQGIWLSHNENLFFGHGTDSQMLVVEKEKERIILAQPQDLSFYSLLSQIKAI